MGWFCSYSVIKKGTTVLERSLNTACYAQYIHSLQTLDKAVIHIAMSLPENGTNQTVYTNKEIVRYFRALQRAGLQFKFNGNNIIKRIYYDYYKHIIVEQGDPIKCYNVEIDLTEHSHMNCQVIMHCVRFLYEGVAVPKAFLKFLDDDATAKKRSGEPIFNKILIAMLAKPGSSHSFGANQGYNLLLTKEKFKEIVTDNKLVSPTTSHVMPKTKISDDMYARLAPQRTELITMVRNGKEPFENILKLYKEECAKYM